MGEPGGERACQIYLAVCAGFDHGVLADPLANGQVAALLLYDDGGAPSADAARGWLGVAHAHGVPLIVAGHADVAEAVSADGVHIPANENLYETVRRQLGADAIIGAGCATSRHDALVLAELGADYVAFGPEPWQAGGEQAPDLVGWWQEVCEPPVVGWHRGGWDEAARLVAAGADFIGVSALIEQADDPAVALDRLSRMVLETAGTG